MKTKFTFLAILIFIGISANAKQRNLEVGKLHFLHVKKASFVKGSNTSQLKHFNFAENQISVPGYSEDFTWDQQADIWQHTTNTTYTYDEVGRLLEEIVLEAVTDIYLTRNSYSYDNYGNVTEEISYTMGNEEWIVTSGEITTYTYTEGNVSAEVTQTWENGSWTNSVKVVYSLNTNGTPYEMQTFVWNGADWINDKKTTSMVWANWQNRELASYSVQYWQEDTWVNGERYSTTFNGNNFTGIVELWENGEWVNSKKETYSRTATDEENILENWTESGWEKDEKYTGTFDSTGNPTGMQYSSWYDIEWVAEMELFFDLTYNESSDVTEMVFRYWDPDLTAPANVTKYQYSSFLHFTTAISDVNVLKGVKVFPNPVSNSFNIRIDEPKITNCQVNITNLAGQTIFNNIFSENQISINTESLNTGMYLLSIKTADGKIYNSKLLKH
jgi:YD repeat-containing protein